MTLYYDNLVAGVLESIKAGRTDFCFDAAHKREIIKVLKEEHIDCVWEDFNNRWGEYDHTTFHPARFCIPLGNNNFKRLHYGPCAKKEVPEEYECALTDSRTITAVKEANKQRFIKR